MSDSGLTPVSVRLPTWIVTEVDQLARDEDRDRTGMVRVLLKEAIETRRSKP